MNWMAFLAQNALRGTIILAAAFAAAAALRNASAALRSLLWISVCGALLALPVALLVVPKWNPLPPQPALSLPHAAVASGAFPTVASAPQAPTIAPRPPRLAWLAVLWAMGSAAAAWWFLLCFRNASWVVRRARPAGYASGALEDARLALGIRRTARVLESSAAPMPLAWGVLRPTVVLPPGASQWPEARLRAVLLHELVHTQRLDLATQAIVQAASCLYWFHPLLWLAARQSYKERELACDDAVLRHVAPSDYAAHLVEVARGMALRRARWAGAAAMARSSDLEDRVRALLDRHRDRRPLTRRAALAVAALALAVLLPAAAITARAEPALAQPLAATAMPAPVPAAPLAAAASPAAPEPAPAPEPQSSIGLFYGVVRDPSGSVVPNCQVRARNVDSSSTGTAAPNAPAGLVEIGAEVFSPATTDPAGEYRLTVPPGRYILEFSAPGFSIARKAFVASAGLSTQTAVNLEIGHVAEEVSVTARKPDIAAPAPASVASQPVQVGGKVEPCTLIRQVKPAYPEDLRLAGIEGIVVVHAIISKDGDVLEPRSVSPDVDPRLVEAALGAVRQWKYRPTLLNGHPVETQTDIDVAFTLQ